MPNLTTSSPLRTHSRLPAIFPSLAVLAFATIPPLQAQQAREPQPPSAAGQAILPDNTKPGDNHDDIIYLSPYEVHDSAKDYGYLKTNAVTATRIGADIQRIPMNISVMSEVFLADTNVITATDVLRFTASGSPDSSFRMRRPANESTPQGNFTMRGFTINSILRNGVHRYAAQNIDNIDRVELVKGPAAVYFGQGYPGGVINFITKKPRFNAPFATFEWRLDNYSGNKVVTDAGTPLGTNAALRIIGAWTDTGGDRRHEFLKNFNLTPSLTLVPFKSRKLKVNLEFEYVKESFNKNQSAWVYNEGWFKDYATTDPARRQALLNAAKNAFPTAKASLFNNRTMESHDERSVADWTWAHYQSFIYNSQSNWMTTVRKLENDPAKPLVTNVSPNGCWTRPGGVRVTDKKFNFTNSGARTENESKVFQATVDFSPLEWLGARHVFTHDNTTYNAPEATVVPNADGYTFNAASGQARPGYWRDWQDHQLDLVFKADFLGIKNKLLAGGVYRKSLVNYADTAGPAYYLAPGYNTVPIDPYANPQMPDPNAPRPGDGMPSPGLNDQVPRAQFLRDRNGLMLWGPKGAEMVYTQWDPAIHPAPPIDKLHQTQRNVLDGYPTTAKAMYINWQADMLNYKLSLFAGYRKEWVKNQGQDLVANAPWFDPPADAYLYPGKYPPDAYNYSPAYAGDPENFRTRSGDSWSAGVSHAISRAVTVYATTSKTFKINTGIAGGYNELALDELLQAALDHGSGSFIYNGHGINRTITSLDEGRRLVSGLGAGKGIENESGMNYEIGVKISTANQKMVSTVSLFRGVRKDQKLDDPHRQSAAEEPFNYSTTMFAPGSPYYNARNFRWRTVGRKNQVTGAEFDLIWTPARNYQAYISGAWLWQAETIDDPSYPKDGSDLGRMFYGTRIENVPEFRLNMVHKYMFTGTALKGMELMLSMRYSSKTVYGRTWDFNPERGGWMAGNYAIFGFNIGYPWRLCGYHFKTTLSIDNLLDRTYYEGSPVPGQPRQWFLVTSMTF